MNRKAQLITALLTVSALSITALTGSVSPSNSTLKMLPGSLRRPP